MSNACRHFLGMYPDPRPQCAKGRELDGVVHDAYPQAKENTDES